MSQVLSFTATGELRDAIQRFLENWRTVGTSKPLGDNNYELTTDNGETCLLWIRGPEVGFEGQIGDQALSLIEEFSQSQGAELLLEGEPLHEAESGIKWEDLNPFVKAGAIALIIVALPILILLLPVALIVLVARLFVNLIRS